MHTCEGASRNAHSQFTHTPPTPLCLAHLSSMASPISLDELIPTTEKAAPLANARAERRGDEELKEREVPQQEERDERQE